MNQEERIQLLQDLIRIPSVNGNELEVAEYLKKLLDKHEIENEIIVYPEDPTRANLIANLPGSLGEGRNLCYSGHFDVVGIGDESKWSHGPFSADIEDGWMFGRGTNDMKGGVAAMIIAMIELKKAGCPFKGNIRFLGVVGEEVGMLGSQQLTKLGYTQDIDALLISEPSSKDIIYSHKGSLQYKIIAHGRAAHSSMPELGINALTLLVDFIYEAERELNKVTQTLTNDKLGPMTNSFTVIEGGEQINSIPSQVTLLGNARTIPEFDNEAVLELMNKIIDRLNKESEGNIELIVTQSLYPMDAEPDTKLIDSILKVSGEDLKVTTFGGATDASNFTRVDRKFDVAIYNLHEGKYAHVIDEKIRVEDYLTSIKQYYEIALDYLNN